MKTHHLGKVAGGVAVARVLPVVERSLVCEIGAVRYMAPVLDRGRNRDILDQREMA